jgi:hypothetical protein
MTSNEQGKNKLFGEGLPGTGGDFIDENDTEGHRNRMRQELTDSGEGEGVIGGGGRARLPGVDGSDENDTEGHLYTGGPTTQGEFAKRAPGDNPHGER